MKKPLMDSPREIDTIEIPWSETTVQFLWGIEVVRTREQKRYMLSTGAPDDVVMTWHGRYTTDFFWMNQEAWDEAKKELKVK